MMADSNEYPHLFESLVRRVKSKAEFEIEDAHYYCSTWEPLNLMSGCISDYAVVFFTPLSKHNESSDSVGLGHEVSERDCTCVYGDLPEQHPQSMASTEPLGETMEQCDLSHQNKKSSVTVHVYTHENDLTAHIDLIFSFSWMVNNNTHSRQAKICLYAANSCISSYRISDLDLDMPMVSAECRAFVKPGNGVIVVTYDADVVWCERLLDTEDFGPYKTAIKRLRSFAIKGATIDIVLKSRTSILDYHLPKYESDAAKDKEKDPLSCLWNQGDFDPQFRPTHVSKRFSNTREYLVPVRVAHRDVCESLTYKAVGTRREQDQEEHNYREEHDDESLLPPSTFKAYKRYNDIMAAAADLVSREQSLSGDVRYQTTDLLTCNRFDRLQSLDLLEDFTEPALGSLRNALCLSQHKVIEALRNMLGGFAVISGCAGAGKTYMLVTILAHIVRSLNEANEGVPRKGLRALITSPINTNVDNLNREFVKVFVNTNAITIRLFPRKMERTEFLWKPRSGGIKLQRLGDTLYQAHHVARCVFARNARARSPASLGTTVVTPEGMEQCIVSWASAILTENVQNDQANVQRARATVPKDVLQSLRTAMQRYDHPEDASAAEEKSIIIQFKELLLALFIAADVVICTILMGAEETLPSFFRPCIFAMDEAARADAVEGLVWARFPDCKYRILLGDLMTSRPQIRSKATNPFGPQMTLSYFAQLILAKFPSVSLYEQHRFVQGIADRLAYPQPITCVPPSTEFTEASQRFAAIWGDSVVLIDIGGFRFRELVSDDSRYNQATAAAVWEFIDRLIRKHGYRPEDIGIITPYFAQANIHKNIAKYRHRQDYGSSISKLTSTQKLMVETVDRAQGLSRRIVILDLPNTSGIGFLADDFRLNALISRACYGLVVIADISGLGQDWNRRNNAIQKFISEQKRNGGPIYKFDPKSTLQELKPHMSTVAPRP